MHVHESKGVEKRFIISIVLTTLILGAEIIGGILSGSLALLSDAAHVFSDIFALALSYVALRIANRPSDDRHSFGWHRMEVVAALINGASLLIIAIGIWVEAYKRWQHPLEIHSGGMMVIAIIGLVVNVAVAFILGGHDHEHDQAHEEKPRNLNVQSAFLHVIGDLISSIGVIIAAILIHLTSAVWIDPLVSVLIGGIILVSSYRILRSSLHILIEGVPEGLSIAKIQDSITRVADVAAIHDLHVWNLCSDAVSLSAHVVLKDCQANAQDKVMQSIKDQLQQEYGIQHTTIQFEQTACGDGHGGCN